MLNAIKKLLKVEMPTVMSEAERELQEAEREFLTVSTKADYYIAMQECHGMRIHRLREIIKTKNVLAMPDFEEPDAEMRKFH